MPRYFFDIRNDGHKLRDVEGSNLINDREAECEAISVLQDMARSLLLDDDQGDLEASVRNAAGQVIFKAKLALTTERVTPSFTVRTHAH